MSTPSLRGIISTDWHLCNPRLPTRYLVTHQDTWLKDNVDYIKKADYFFIDGDIFNNATPLHRKDTLLALEHLVKVVGICIKHNTAVRILNGTTSHDYSQAEFMESFQQLNDKLDIRFISELSIETSSNGINILYVPDELNVDSKVTIKQILDLKIKQGIDHIDLAHVHGSFKFNLPSMAITDACFDEEEFMTLCRGPIYNGHIHTKMTYKRIHTVGSIDRYAHGEEEDKGGMYIDVIRTGDVDKPIEYTNIFLPNHNACVFKTLRLSDKTHGQVIETYAKTIKELIREEEPINIRLVLDPLSPLHNQLDRIILNNENVILKVTKDKDIIDESEVDIGIVEEEDTSYDSITKDNLFEILSTYLLTLYDKKEVKLRLDMLKSHTDIV